MKSYLLELNSARVNASLEWLESHKKVMDAANSENAIKNYRKHWRQEGYYLDHCDVLINWFFSKVIEICSDANVLVDYKDNVYYIKSVDKDKIASIDARIKKAISVYSRSCIVTTAETNLTIRDITGIC